MAGLLASIACGIVGSYIVAKRIVFISGGIAHAAFGGIGLGYLLGVNPILGAVLFSIVAALGMGTVGKWTRVREDTTIGMLWSMGMALGIVFIGLSPGYAPDLFSYLFGSILTVPSYDIVTMLLLDAIIVLVVFSLYKQFLALTFDEEFAIVVGVPTERLYIVLLCLIALTVVILIKVVGVILVIALLTIPSATAAQYTLNLKEMMFLSVILGIVFTTCGLWLSYVLNLASGATIVLVSGTAFLLSLILRKYLE